MKKIFATIFLLVSLLITIRAHDIHVSVSDIVIKENAVEITIKTFLDDLQAAMGLEPREALPEGYSSAKELIGMYIQEQIQFSIDNKDINLTPSEIDASNDAVWITIKIENVNIESIKELTWNSTFLNDTYADQKNIVNIKKDGKREVFSLSSKKTSLTYTL
jgi:hypothetical protein